MNLLRRLLQCYVREMDAWADHHRRRRELAELQKFAAAWRAEIEKMDREDERSAYDGWLDPPDWKGEQCEE